MSVDKIYTVDEIKNVVIPIAADYGVDALYLFGSYARGSANSESDIDFRVDKGSVRGIKFAGLYLSLESALGKNIDLVTLNSLDEDLKRKIKKEEILLYAK